MRTRKMLAACFLMCLTFAAARADAAELLVGAATADITPEGPVALLGQFYLRVSQKAETPLVAGVLVLESRESGQSVDSAVMVACDLCLVRAEVLAQVREEVGKRVPDLDVKKIFLSATHTHTAPVLEPGSFILPEGVTPVEDYVALLVRRIAEAIEKAWAGRAPGSFTFGLTDAVVAYNRRAVYANGSAAMYGKADRPDFMGIEGCEENDVGTLFFWNADGKLLGICVNVSSPSQELMHLRAIHADFWHPVREALHQQYGEDVCILAWCGAAGDQNPHPYMLYRKAAEERMRRLRGGNETARRIVRAVSEAYEVVKDERYANVPMTHLVETIALPMRKVTEAEYAAAKAARQKVEDEIAGDPKAADRLHRRMKWYGRTVNRFESLKDNPNPTYDMELHVLRLGDVAICTNPFELFTEYGVRIKGRSKAVQTFLIQLTGGGTYLPTERAVHGGSYSAVVESSHVGPEGGQMLVDRTVQAIDSLWAPRKE